MKPEENKIQKSLRNRNGEYAFLPTSIRDFHDQKELFKGLYKNYKGWIEHNSASSYMFENLKNISWVDMQILTCDYMLYNLAKMGYILRKSDKFKNTLEDNNE